MIDITREQIRTLSQAAQELPGRPHVSTLWRWSRRGVRGVTLETVSIGGRRYTSREALGRFTAALSDHHTASGPRPSTPDRARALQTERELDRAGF
jgi:hypothetical protein